MMKLSNNIKLSLKDTLLFGPSYFIIFLFLIKTFSDGGQTTGMFVLIDLFIVIIVTVYYLLLNLTMQFTGKTMGILSKTLFFFVLAELSAYTLTGEIPIFGLLRQYVYSKNSYSGNKSLDNSIYSFRQGRDFAFSIAGSMSAIIFIVVKRMTRDNSHQHKL